MSSVGVGRGGGFTKAQEGEGGGIGLAMVTGIFWIRICICKTKEEKRNSLLYRDFLNPQVQLLGVKFERWVEKEFGLLTFFLFVPVSLATTEPSISSRKILTVPK